MADFSDNVPNPRDAGGDKMDRSLEEALRAYEEMPCKAQQINGLEYHRIIASYTMPLTCKGLVVCALPRPPFPLRRQARLYTSMRRATATLSPVLRCRISVPCRKRIAAQWPPLPCAPPAATPPSANG